MAGQLPVGFYAGAPLVSSVDGHRYGTLCVIDFRPRTFPPDRYQMLCHFSEICVRELEQALVSLGGPPCSDALAAVPRCDTRHGHLILDLRRGRSLWQGLLQAVGWQQFLVVP